MGEVGDPNITAGIAIDDVSFGNKTCEKLPKGKFKLISPGFLLWIVRKTLALRFCTTALVMIIANKKV